MVRNIILSLSFLICFSSFAQKDETKKIKFRKLNYIDFKAYSVNDTSTVIIDIFFDKSGNAAVGQMSITPIAMATYLISPQIGIVLTAVSMPFFINGSYMLVKYRKKKLYKVLVEYRDTKQLPKWVRRKANKQLDFYEKIKLEY